MRKNTAWVSLIAFAAMPLATCHTALAQSSYTLTKLNPPTSKRAMWASCIDDKNQVFGEAEYYKRTIFVWNLPGFVTEYDTFAVRWPATTATSALPTKISKRGYNSHYSAHCTKLAVSGYLIDTATGQETPLPTDPPGGPAWQITYAPNDAGMVVWETGVSGGTWTKAGGTQPLPTGGHPIARPVSLINNRGDVAGEVADADHQQGRAAVWFDGELKVIDDRPDGPSFATDINDNRQVLIGGFKAIPPPPSTNGEFIPWVVTSTTVLWDNGVIKPLLPPGDTHALSDALINNRGVVMACLGMQGSTNCEGETRAVIWRDGVASDLTELVKSKGAVMPSGAVLTRVLALNDAGSFVAVMKAGNGVVSTVRLTAKP